MEIYTDKEILGDALTSSKKTATNDYNMYSK